MEYDPRIDAIATDCSGFVLKVLHEAGITLPDMTSQDLYNYCERNGHASTKECDALLFFGESENKVTHVAISMGNGYMIEAGGAGTNSLKLTKKELLERNAKVRIVKIDRRSDLVASVLLEKFTKKESL